MSEKRLIEQVNAAESVVDAKLDCPECGKRLVWDGACPDEEYRDGEFWSIETYECEDCRLYVNVTQVYRAAERRVSVEEL